MSNLYFLPRHANCVNGCDRLQSATKMLLRNNAGRNISQMLLLVKEENKKDLAEKKLWYLYRKTKINSPENNRLGVHSGSGSKLMALA